MRVEGKPDRRALRGSSALADWPRHRLHLLTALQQERADHIIHHSWSFVASRHDRRRDVEDVEVIEKTKTDPEGPPYASSKSPGPKNRTRPTRTDYLSGFQ